MKNTGIVRKLDELGRITLPSELRRTFGIEEGDPLEIFTSDDVICLKKIPEKKCKLCETDNDLKEIDGIFICKNCAIKISHAFSKKHSKSK